MSKILSANCTSEITALLFEEVRPRPPSELTIKAERNLADIRSLVSDVEVLCVDIFSDDLNTVVGGRAAVNALAARDLSGFTDVVMDFSAISTGVSFPATKFLFEMCERSAGRASLHLMVAASPSHDNSITALAGDVVTSVHGFRGDVGVSGRQPAKLWLPQLKVGQEMTLARLFENIAPDDTCPILPFPANNARIGDELLEAYSESLRDWDVDPRDVIYASEGDPLDVYRTIMRLNAQRNEVFTLEGSLVILSPVGSKVVAIGSLMAALEGDLAIRYLEAENFVVISHSSSPVKTSIVHVWLVGAPVWEM